MRKLIHIVAVAALVPLLSCSNPPSVIQGKVVSYDGEKKVLVLEDELPPRLQRSLDLKSAEVGGTPAPGNVVRIAYRDQGGTLVAGRVMNLTQQKKK
jgi:hypothetical protein